MINEHLVSFMIHKLDDLKLTISKADFYKEKEQLSQELSEAKFQIEQLKQELFEANIKIEQLSLNFEAPIQAPNLNGKKIRHIITTKTINSVKYGKYNSITQKIISDSDNIEYSVSRFCINHYNEIGYRTNKGKEVITQRGWDKCKIEIAPNSWQILMNAVKR